MSCTYCPRPAVLRRRWVAGNVARRGRITVTKAPFVRTCLRASCRMAFIRTVMRGVL